MHKLFTITALQIGVLRNISYKTARKEWLAIRDSLQLDRAKPLTLGQVATYYDACVVELAETLYKFKKK